MRLLELAALVFELIWASPLEPQQTMMWSSPNAAWVNTSVTQPRHATVNQPRISPVIVLPAKMQEGSLLRRDVIPFVGKVILNGAQGEQKQFTCVLAGRRKDACVTTAHSFIEAGSQVVSRDAAGIATVYQEVIVEFEACERMYAARSIDLIKYKIVKG